MLNIDGINPLEQKGVSCRFWGALTLCALLSGCVSSSSPEERQCSEEQPCPDSYDCVEGSCIPNLCEGGSVLRCNAEQNAIESVCGQEVSVVFLCPAEQRCIAGSVRCVSPEDTLDQPVDMEPVDMEPVDMGPVDMEPVDMEPVDMEPVDMEPVDMEPVDMEPVDMEPVDMEPVDMEPVDMEPVDMDPTSGAQTFAVTVSHSSGDLQALSSAEGTVDVQLALGPNDSFQGSCSTLMLQAQLEQSMNVTLSAGTVIQTQEITTQPRRLINVDAAPLMTLFVSARGADSRALHAGCTQFSHSPTSQTTELAITLRPLPPLHHLELYQFGMGLRLDQVLRHELDQKYQPVIAALLAMVDTPRMLDDLFIAVLCMHSTSSECATYTGIEASARLNALEGFQADRNLMNALSSLGRAIQLLNALSVYGTLERLSARRASPSSDVLVEDFSVNWQASSSEAHRDMPLTAPGDAELSAQWSFWVDEAGELSLKLSALQIEYSLLLTRYAEELGTVNYPGDARLSFSLCSDFEARTFTPGLCSESLRPMLEGVIEVLTEDIELSMSDFSFQSVPVSRASHPNRYFTSWTAQDLGATHEASSGLTQAMSLCFSACRDSAPEGCDYPCF